MQERDRGEHSLGAVWRRERLTCLTREELSGYLFQTHDEARRTYIDFHLQTVGCPYCTANLADLAPGSKKPKGRSGNAVNASSPPAAGFLKGAARREKVRYEVRSTKYKRNPAAFFCTWYFVLTQYRTRLDRVEPRRLPRRIEAEKDPDRAGNAHRQQHDER